MADVNPTRPDRPWLIAAAVTPLTADGTQVDEAAIAPMTSFLEAHGVDGVLACGTTGEGILLEPAERRRVAEAFRRALAGRLIVHCGAQATAQTVELATHAAGIGADGVAVIPPPYFRLDEPALLAHFVAAAQACAPTPFYCYAFAARSGYPLPVRTLQQLRERVDNLAGIKVSEQPWSAVEPYLSAGVPVLVGNEPLIPQALAAGAYGAVSGLAAAFPEVVAEALADPTPAAGDRLRTLRDACEASGQFIAAAKHVLGLRGVPVAPAVRAPLRPLLPAELAQLTRDVEPLLAAS